MPLYSIDDIAPELPPEGQYWIAPNASVIGKVRLAKDVGIWFGAVLRGDTDWLTIGEGSNIQDNSVVHADGGQPTTIGKHVTVGHNVILHACTVGDYSLIGMGAVLLNRCRIGTDCIVGAGALVTEGKEFPDGSLILGNPARAVKSTTEAQRAAIRISAEQYILNQRRFSAGLKRLG